MMPAASLSPLAAAINAKFTAHYLFDSDHDAWRSIVFPEGDGVAGDGGPPPPPVPVACLLGFADITTRCSSMNEAERVAEICATVLAHNTANPPTSQLLVDVVEEGGKHFLRRREWLREEENPLRRTVFAKPIHVDATEQHIRSFFAQFGAVEEVELRTFVDPSGVKRRPSAFITFATEHEARACVARRPSYGSLETDLGNFFIPKLTVVMKDAYLERAASGADHDHAQQQRKELIAATCAQQAAPDAAPSRRAFGDSKKFLTAGRAAVAVGIPEGVTWQQLKAHLGNLAIDLRDLAGKITLVKVLELGEEDAAAVGDDARGRRAFVITKTPKAMEDLVLAFNRASGEHATKLRQLVPTLRAATPAEDRLAVRRFPEWSKRKEAPGGAEPAPQRQRQE